MNQSEREFDKYNVDKPELSVHRLNCELYIEDFSVILLAKRCKENDRLH